jgi:threonyl-tRNA synthetase
MEEKQDQLHAMRHSLAHILATAIKHKYPSAKFGVGPVVENGFYYDIDLGEDKLSEDDFEAIEGEMRKIISEDEQFIRSTKPIDDAIAWAKDNDQPYKLELLNDLKTTGTTDINVTEVGSGAEEVSFYQNGDFLDLCKGPHVESTSKVGAFKLLRVSGAYWRGDEHKPQMQRVYGAAFATQEELDKYLANVEEAKKRDHRKLGQELDLFVFSDLVGSGLPIFTPRGTVLREELARYSAELKYDIGFEKVAIPHLTKIDLYEKSGHAKKFGDELLLVTSKETKDPLVLKPMNCPHHLQIYLSRPRTYKELPIRYMEVTTMYRDEKSGELNGLYRVRSISIDDSHELCTPEQMQTEISNLLQAIQKLYDTLDLGLRVRLSYRDDSDAYLGSKELWNSAQEQLKQAVEDNKIEYFIQEGEAAFYGPKIDFMATDALGREHQVATIQLDFVMPERFGLEYVDANGQKARPVLIHCAILGSIERFLSVYIEHVGGNFPVWLAPEQIRFITLNQTDEIVDFASELLKEAKNRGLRATVDNDNQSVGKKIRDAELMKVPYVIVIGGKELESKTFSPRIRHDLVSSDQVVSLSSEDFFNKVSEEAKNRTKKSTLNT